MTDIIRRKSDNVVTHAGEFQQHGDGTFAYFGGTVLSVSSETHERITGVSLPDWFSGKTHTYDTTNGWQRTSYGSTFALDERKAAMSDQAAQEYDASLGRGFSYDGATWPANGRKRTRVHEIATQIANGKALPNGKTSMTFVDASGTSHSLGSTQIVELGAAGQDLIDAADDRLAQLEADIAAATSHSGLDAIDVTSGWP